MSPKATLYGNYKSPSTRGVLLTLKALGLDFDMKLINPLEGDNRTPEFLKLNPQHTIPTFVDTDGKVIWDSHAIIAYLVSKYAKNDSLYPKDFYERAVVDQRLHYENGVLFSTILKGISGPIFAGTVTKQLLADKQKSIDEAYDLLENFLGSVNFIAGANLTIADFSIAPTLLTLAIIQPIEASKHPKLSAWLKRIEQLPYYKEATGNGLEELSAFLTSKLSAIN